MPLKVFREAYNGAVTVRVVLNSDGTVRDARLMGSSGHGDLDDLALQTVMKWRLDPKEVRPSDLTEGRGQIIGFKQGGPPPRELTPSGKAYWALLR
ncbi:MAG TPA: energy transducer TonB [Chthoniobacterales bacterium]|jgi:TonB family protein